MRTAACFVTLLTVVATVLLVPASPASAADFRTRAFRASGVLTPANGDSRFPALSADNRLVVFQSDASNLAVGGGGLTDIYTADRWSGAIRCLSSGLLGQPSNGRSVSPAMSRNGARVVFATTASNVVGGDENGAYDVILAETASGTRLLVSASSSAGQGNSDSHSPAISGSGAVVAFVSSATNFDTDTAGFDDIFVRDIAAGTVERISVAIGGGSPNGNSAAPVLSYDGRYVAFSSQASNIVAGDTNGASDVFVFDRATQTAVRVSVGASGQANLGSFAPAISDNGMRIAFESLATNLVSGDENGVRDVFVRDISAATTVRASTGGLGETNGESRDPSLSANGTRVGFTSRASNLVSGDTNQRDDFFIRDLSALATRRVSIFASTQANGTSGGGVISADGLHAAFHSSATNLTPVDRNGRADIFVTSWAARPVYRLGGGSYDIAVAASRRSNPYGAQSVILANPGRWYEALPAATLAGTARGPLLYAPATGLPTVTRNEIARLAPSTVYVIGSNASLGPNVVASLQRLVPGARIVRITARDRYSLAWSISSHAARARGGSLPGTVLVVSGTDYGPSMGAASLAAAYGYPVVLADSRRGTFSLPAGTKRAVILGTTSSVSSRIESKLRSRLGRSAVRRVGSADRAATAVSVASIGVASQRLAWERVEIVNSARPADAISMGTMAGRTGGVVLLATSRTLPRPTQLALRRNGLRTEYVYITGSATQIGSRVVAAVGTALGR